MCQFVRVRTRERVCVRSVPGEDGTVQQGEDAGACCAREGHGGKGRVRGELYMWIGQQANRPTGGLQGRP